MSKVLDCHIVKTIARRTFRHLVESPIAYVVAIFFYSFVGGIYGAHFFRNNQAAVDGIGMIAPWLLWFVVPALTMGLISEETRSGTFESLSTLPIRDWEIVLGKYLGFAMLALILIVGLGFFPVLVSMLTDHPNGIDWGSAMGMLAGLFLLTLFYGSMGLWASSLMKNQVVVLILGMILCTLFFFLGQFYALFPGVLAQMADFFGISSHMETLLRGVFDLRDLFYFSSMVFIFLYFTVQRLSTRRY